MDEAPAGAAQAVAGAGRRQCEFLAAREPQGSSATSPATRTRPSSWSPTCPASSQPVELDLAAFQRACPSSCSAGREFPADHATSPTSLTLGPHGFYWFSLESAGPGGNHLLGGARRPRMLTVAGEWSEVFAGKAKTALGSPASRLPPDPTLVRRKGQNDQAAHPPGSRSGAGRRQGHGRLPDAGARGLRAR